MRVRTLPQVAHSWTKAAMVCYGLTNDKVYRKCFFSTLSALEKGDLQQARANCFRFADDAYWREHHQNSWEIVVKGPTK